MALQYPNRKGFIYSFPSLSVLSGVELIKGLQKFDCSPKIEGRKMVYGSGRKPMGRTRGTLTVPCAVTFVKDSFFEWIATHPEFLDEEYDFTGVYEEGSRRNKVEVFGLCFDESSMPDEGTEELKVELTGFAFDVLIDGRSPIVGDAIGIGDDAGAA